MNGCNIRPAVPDDQPRIKAIVTAAYSPYIARIGKPPGPMLDDYAQRIADEQAYVLETERRIAGILVLEPGDGFLLLDNIAIDPACQGAGHGRTLMAFAEDSAQRRGYDRILLYTHALMSENIAIYRRYGYLELERKTVHGFDRVYMEKTSLSRAADYQPSGLHSKSSPSVSTRKPALSLSRPRSWLARESRSSTSSRGGSSARRRASS